MKALVIGGGIFGVCTAIELAKLGLETHLFEKNKELMLEATSVNQNRFHLGYHYPRSVATAKQSLEGIPSFLEYFSEALISTNKNYYAISKRGSRVSFEQYVNFCKNLKLPCKESYPSKYVLNRSKVSGCIVTDEKIIDLSKMKSIAENLLKQTRVKVFLGRPFEKKDENNFQIIVNSSYSNLNNVNKLLGLPTRIYRYDICNVPVLNLPRIVRGIGITIMDGDFYSILPFGNTKYHLFWSVTGSTIRSTSVSPPQKITLKTANYHDDTFVPLLKRARCVDILRVTKILRPDVELSDDRVTDLINYGNGRFSILSAKLNTCVLTARRIVKLVKENSR